MRRVLGHAFSVREPSPVGPAHVYDLNSSENPFIGARLHDGGESGPAMFDLHRLRLLRELKHRGTLAAVASALSYAPSSVSQQLSQLEAEVGVPLLEPVGRRVRLTEQAEILVAHTEAVLARLERAEAEIAASLTDLAGTLRIASFQTAALALIPAALGLLRDQHPRLRVHVTHMEPENAPPRCKPAISTWCSPRSTPAARTRGPPNSNRRTCSTTTCASRCRSHRGERPAERTPTTR